MSRGPGRIERAVKGAFDAQPNHTFTTDELCVRVFVGVERIEKKHRVSLIRAAKRVVARERHWRMMRANKPGAPLVFYSSMGVDVATPLRLPNEDSPQL